MCTVTLLPDKAFCIMHSHIQRLKYFLAFVITDVSDTQQCDLIEFVLTKQWQASPSDLLKTSHAYKYTIDLRSRAGAVTGIPSLQE